MKAKTSSAETMVNVLFMGCEIKVKQLVLNPLDSWPS